MIETAIDRVTGNTVVLASVVLLSVFYLATYVFGGPSKVSFEAPRLYDERKTTDITKLHGMVKSEFQKYKDKFFSLGEAHAETIVLPVKYVEELKALPSDVLSFERANDEMFLSEYTLLSSRSLGGDSHTVINSVKNDLTRSLGTLMADIYDEMLYAFETEMPPCEDWTEVDINLKLIKIVALVSGRVFIGKPLCRNAEYLECIIMFTLNCFMAAPAVRKYPALLRPLARYWCPELVAVHKSLDTMKRLMAPVIEENARAIEAGTAPRDMNTWNMVNAPASLRENITVQSHNQLAVSMAAVHTTSMTTTHIVFDLAARPEYLEPLREEIEAVKATETSQYLSKTSMPKLKKLDSFLKESQRLNPLALIHFRRKVLSPITLHDGHVLPAGTHIAVASSQIAQDPALWDRPEQFDGFRFAKLREKPGQESRHQFVTTGLDSLQFGHGSHACPGRFFANNEIKMITGYLIENYDMKFAEGVGRPANMYTPGGYAPSRDAMVWMKRRVKA